MTKDYHKHTGYLRCADIKRLDYIVDSLEKCGIESGSKGLDLGCGKGNITIPLASIGYKMIGIDISSDNIKSGQANQIANDNPIFISDNAECFELEEDNFDFIIASEILEHLNHPEYALNLIYSKLRDKGLLIVTVPNGYGPYSLIHDHFRGRVVSKLFEYPLTDHVQFFTVSKISNLINAAGFDILNINHSDFISFFPIFSKSKKNQQLDCKLADKLPHFMVSGYYIVCRK